MAMKFKKSYGDLLKQVYSMRPKKTKDLSKIMMAAAALGNPQNAIRYVHVTGTNGKGSVCWKLAAAFQASGYKVGLFTSPHIATYRERFRVNGQMIGEVELEKHLEAVFDMGQREGLLVDMSFFDVATLVAFLHFTRQQVDVVVMEVGIGGRLDPTNIIPPSCLAVVTSVALEHTEYLGDTREAIAWDKCHIIKEKMPAVIGPRVPLEVAAARCAEVGGRLHVVPPPPIPDFDAENRAVVAECVRVLQAEGEFPALTLPPEALDSTPPCRLEVWAPPRLQQLDLPGPTPAAVVFDVAHNPDAVRALAARLTAVFPGRPLVGLIGCSADKDVAAIRETYAECFTSLHLAPVAHFRLLPCAALAERLAGLPIPVHTYGEGGGPEEVAQCRAAWAACLDTPGSPVVVAVGSFFTLRPLRAAVGLHDPSDPV